MNKTHICARLCFIIIAVLVMGASGHAWARGDGIKAGSGRLHFGLDLELTFDSNPGYFPSGNENKYFDLMMRTRPIIGLDFPSDAVSFSLDGKVGYDYYFGIDNSLTKRLSSVSGEAGLKLGFNPNGQFSVFVTDDFARTSDPRYTSLTGRFDRTDNEAKLLFQIKPGGGALMFDLAYGFWLDWFDDNPDIDSRSLSSYAHRAYFSGKWKFLPKTALSLDFDADIRRYPYGSRTSDIRNPDVNGIRATIGLIGQISPSISLIIKAGYGDSLLSGGIRDTGDAYAGKNYRSVVGQAEMSYKAATTLFQFGYTRNFQPVMLFAYFGQDHFYLRFKQQLAGRFDLTADVGFDLLGYGQALFENTNYNGNRFDYFLTGGAGFAYHILDWITLALDYRIQSLFSDYQQPLAGSGGVDYIKHMVIFRVGLDY